MSDLSNYAKDLQESAGNTDAAISEGILNLKSKIKGMDLKPIKGDKSPAQKSVEGKNSAEPSPVTAAVDKFRSKIRQDSGIETPVAERPVTKASIENTKAVARALAGQRSSGNTGTPVDVSGGANQRVDASGDYASLVTSMTLEEYQSHIFSSFGLSEESQETPEVVSEALSSTTDETLVSVLTDRLLHLEDRSWQEVDRVTRQVCIEGAATLKDLNKLFREEHGMYPDKWAKLQEELDLAGYFPLEEATRIHKMGQVYDVSFIYRGGTQRFSFFWPEATRPTFEDMQAAVQKFYPRARLLTFYLSKSQDPNFMVAVPPMHESFDFVSEDTWVEMSEVDAHSYDCICEEVGEPVASPVSSDDGGYAVMVENHDTGEEEVIYFGEGIGAIFQKKEKTPEQKRKEKEKQLKDTERTIKHLNHPFSDVSKNATRRYAAKKSVTEGAAWTRKEGQNSEGGLNEKGRKSYERENPGSDLKKPQPEGGSRRDSYCARSKGQQEMHNIDCSDDPDKRICKARRKWNC